jgi:hypothetical protein
MERGQDRQKKGRGLQQHGRWAGPQPCSAAPGGGGEARSPNDCAAPANSDSMSTPALSRWQATYS